MVNFALRRQVGHYVLDYYVPSMLLVAMSWIAFWLHPSAVPGRTTLGKLFNSTSGISKVVSFLTSSGTSTWLTFITLTHNTGNQLPKVSYVKYIDVWFLVCTLFIIASFLEFAFVNSISRLE
jgi:hypothetical protein